LKKVICLKKCLKSIENLWIILLFFFWILILISKSLLKIKLLLIFGSIRKLRDFKGLTGIQVDLEDYSRELHPNNPGSTPAWGNSEKILQTVCP